MVSAASFIQGLFLAGFDSTPISNPGRRPPPAHDAAGNEQRGQTRWPAPGSSRGHHWAVLMAVSGSFPGHLWAAFHGRLHTGAHEGVLQGQQGQPRGMKAARDRPSHDPPGVHVGDESDSSTTPRSCARR
ncbi:Uncharacterised protein [Streptococcus pneumoniae]|nr:Uncharacterised protein [Streptococcus pneumoniae]